MRRTMQLFERKLRAQIDLAVAEVNTRTAALAAAQSKVDGLLAVLAMVEEGKLAQVGPKAAKKVAAS